MNRSVEREGKHSVKEVAQHELLHDLNGTRADFRSDYNNGYPRLLDAVRKSYGKVPQWVTDDLPHAFTTLGLEAVNDPAKSPPAIREYFRQLLPGPSAAQTGRLVQMFYRLAKQLQYRQRYRL